MVIPFRKNRQAISKLKEDHLKLQTKFRKLKVQMSRTYKWEGTDDDNTQEKAYTGNRYKKYSTAIEAINEKYENEADWGCLYVGNIVDIRAALITGQGLDISKKKEITPDEEAFLVEFIETNKLDGVYAINTAKESELEGRYLFQMRWDSEHEWTTFTGEKELENGVKVKRKGMVKIIFLTWSTENYKVIVDDNDYQEYIAIEFEGKKPDLESPQFVYAKLGGKIDRPNKPVPKIWRALTNIDNLDMTLTDLRLGNHLYATPKPVIEVDDEDDVDDVADSVEPNQRVGAYLVIKGKHYFVSPDMSGAAALISEAAVNAKVISGGTGVPVHYLGFVDEMSNRSTAESLVDSLNAATTIERETSQSVWNEVFTKSTELYNKNSDKTALNPQNYEVEINIVTAEQWARIEKIFLPAKEKKLISSRTFFEQIPGMDPDEELKRINEEADRELSALKETLRDDDIPSDGDDGDEINEEKT